MRQKRKLVEHVWYKVRLAVILLSSVAVSFRRAVAHLSSNVLNVSSASIGWR